MKGRQCLALLPQKIKLSAQMMVGLLLLVLLSATLTRADSPNRVGLVVVHGDGEVVTRCIEFSEADISGYEVLEQSGLDLNIDVNGGLGTAVCRIDQEGCTFPEDTCFCQCAGGGQCRFWSYWYWEDDAWKFSALGASNYRAHAGEVQAWVWGQGVLNQSASPPPVIGFDEICQTVSPTNTPVPPTATPTPTVTPTPKPTDTPEPEPTPVIAYFSADRTTVNAGEAVTLSWDLSGAEAVYLRYDGQSEGVVAPGSKTMTPVQTTVYRLAARNKAGHETVAELTVTVNAAAAPAQTSSQPTSQLTSNQPNAQLPSQPASQITEPVPQPPPLISFNSASPVLPLGACTNLSWSVQHAEAVYLDGVEVEPESSRQVCPDQPQTYSLKALYAGGERTAQVRLEVVEAIATAAAANPTAAIAEPVASPTLPQPSTPTLAATTVSQQVIPTVESRPIRRNLPAPETNAEEQGWSLWAKLGIWGGLIGGWCFIALGAGAIWGGVWWVSSRRQRK